MNTGLWKQSSDLQNIQNSEQLKDRVKLIPKKIKRAEIEWVEGKDCAATFSERPFSQEVFTAKRTVDDKNPL